jgi:pimeloyl-ACP methyl ester carboxylesterase
MYGCPQAVELMERFREHVVRQFGLAPQAALFGFSRGGLYAFHYAAAYPQGVASLYLDAPVLDICSWPGGKGEGTGNRANWQQCLDVYGWTEAEADLHRDDLQDKAKASAAAGIPVLIVAGDADEVVPMDENSSRLAALYSQFGGELQLIVKPGVGHHPHSLEDPKPIVDFVVSHSKLQLE